MARLVLCLKTSSLVFSGLCCLIILLVTSVDIEKQLRPAWKKRYIEEKQVKDINRGRYTALYRPTINGSINFF